MRLAKLSEYRSICFTPESAPTMATLRKKIDNGKIPGGRVIDRRYFVDLDELDKVTNIHAQIVASERELAAHPLLRGLV